MPTIPQEPLDYLTVGHVTKDLANNSFTLGGTASYSPLTALAFRLRCGVLTACAADLSLSMLKNVAVHRKPSEYTTTFENIETGSGREQYLHTTAERLTVADVPDTFLHARILHLGPLDNEVDMGIAAIFPQAFIGLTPQGWMRRRSEDSRVTYQEWNPPDYLTERADAVALSIEDVYGDEDLIADYARQFKILAVTEGYNGARVYWHGDVRRFNAPKVAVVDPTGAGDIFAAAFFIRLEATRDPWEAAAFAVNLASLSVTRKGLFGVPRPEEVQSCLVEITRGPSLA